MDLVDEERHKCADASNQSVSAKSNVEDRAGNTVIAVESVWEVNLNYSCKVAQ